MHRQQTAAGAGQPAGNHPAGNPTIVSASNPSRASIALFKLVDSSASIKIYKAASVPLNSVFGGTIKLLLFLLLVDSSTLRAVLPVPLVPKFIRCMQTCPPKYQYRYRCGAEAPSTISVLSTMRPALPVTALAPTGTPRNPFSEPSLVFL